MSEPAPAHAQGPAQPSLLAKLFLLPFHLFGVLCGALLLSITIECIGVAFFWPEEGERHARDMLDYELGQFSGHFRQSVLVPEPGRAARELSEWAYGWVFIRSGLADGLREARAQSGVPLRFLAIYLVLGFFLLS